jgi:hypothetical protein
MTGLEHYREAERLLDAINDIERPIPVAELEVMQQRAQVHATLALTAATILAAPPDQNHVQAKRWGNWADVVGEQS